MSTYAWIIDRVNTEELGDDCADEVRTVGPWDAGPEALAELAKGRGHVFRMLDDDGIWYYRGRIVVLDGERPTLYESSRRRHIGHIASVPWDEAEAFGPLWDFGTPNAGCTELQYRVAGPDGPVWATV